MKIDPIERYTVLKVVTYPTGEQFYQAVVDDQIFSSLDDANEFLRELISEEFKEELTRQSTRYDTKGVSCVGTYDDHADGDGCATGTIRIAGSKERIDIQVVLTKFTLPGMEGDKKDDE